MGTRRSQYQSLQWHDTHSSNSEQEEHQAAPREVYDVNMQPAAADGLRQRQIAPSAGSTQANVDAEISAALSAFRDDAARDGDLTRHPPSYEELVPKFTNVLHEPTGPYHAGPELELTAQYDASAQRISANARQSPSSTYTYNPYPNNPDVPLADHSDQAEAAYLEPADYDINLLATAQFDEPEVWEADEVELPPLPSQPPAEDEFLFARQHKQVVASNSQNGTKGAHPPIWRHRTQSTAQIRAGSGHTAQMQAPYSAGPAKQQPPISQPFQSPGYRQGEHKHGGIAGAPTARLQNYHPVYGQDPVGAKPTHSYAPSLPVHPGPPPGGDAIRPPVPAVPAQRAQHQQHFSRHHDEQDPLKRRQLEAYFGRRPVWVPLSIVTGLLFIFHPWRFDPLYGMELALDIPLFGGLALILLGLYREFLAVQKPLDRSVDDVTVESLNGFEAEALDQMGLSKADLIVPPVVFAGFPDLEKCGSAFHASKIGKDSILRYTPKALTILAFRQDDVVAYEGAIDLTTGTCVYERVNEFFYSDITNIGIKRQSVRRRLFGLSLLKALLSPWRAAFVDRLLGLFSETANALQNCHNSRDVFFIGLSNGDAVLSVLRDGRFSSKSAHDELPSTMSNEFLPTIRQLVRQKKNEQYSPQNSQRTTYN